MTRFKITFVDESTSNLESITHTVRADERLQAILKFIAKHFGKRALFSVNGKNIEVYGDNLFGEGMKYAQDGVKMNGYIVVLYKYDIRLITDSCYLVCNEVI